MSYSPLCCLTRTCLQESSGATEAGPRQTYGGEVSLAYFLSLFCDLDPGSHDLVPATAPWTVFTSKAFLVFSTLTLVWLLCPFLR